MSVEHEPISLFKTSNFPSGERQSTKAHPDGKFHERKTDCNKNTLTKKAKQEENIPERTLNHNTSNGLDLHIHKSSKPNCGKLEPNWEVLAFQFKPIQNYKIPKKRPLLETTLEGTHSAFVDLNEDATQRSVQPRQPHSTHDSASLLHVPSSFTPASSYTNNIQEDPIATCDHAQDGTTFSRRGTEDVTDTESNRSDHLSRSIAVDSPRSISKSKISEGFLTGGDGAESDGLKDSRRNADVEIGAGKQENGPKRTLKHHTSNKLDLHTRKSAKQDCGKLKPNLKVFSFQLKRVLNGRIPKKRPFLEREVTKDTHSGQNATLGVTEDATQRSLCPGQAHDTHASSSARIPSSFTSHMNSSQENPVSTCDHAQDWTAVLEDVADEESDGSDHLSRDIPVDSSRSMPKSEDDLDDFWAGGDESQRDSPTYFMWHEGESDGEGSADVKFGGASQDERRFVCPRAYQRIMDGLANTLTHEENVNCEISKVRCQQILSQVYITMEENHHEGTLQLLSDLLHPGYCPPKDVTSHLLSGILLDPLCPHHLCVQASNLLMRAQRHHLLDKNTVPWSWEMLTAVMSAQDEKTKHRPEVVRMLLEYIVQTLEDDFCYKKSTSELHHSIARATLSCNQRFPQVQDVIKWLFSAIIKSTESGTSIKAAREKDEHIRIVSSLQRMLTLALEADRSPTLSAPKLSQELFLTLISIEPLRAHRQLLLDSLQSSLLRWKLLESLLDYASPLKSAAPMSLSRLLYFLENCTLAADPTDDGVRWKKWDELVQHLWMLLVSYNTTMNGYLCSSVSEQISRPGSLVCKSNDVLTKAAICKSVEAFLTRSQADVGQALPLHVEESLTYLQDFLLDVCN
ncbi:uncharacterized protein simc1 isoform X2 [Vanacampus margaritifer]